MTFIQRGCETIIQKKLVLLWLLVLIPFFGQIQAMDISEPNSKPETFKTPETLLENKIENKQDAIKLMQSEEFKAQLLVIANKIDYETDTEITDNNKIALSSLLSQTDKVLALVNKNKYPLNLYHYSLYAKAQAKSQKQGSLFFERKLNEISQNSFKLATDENFHKISYALGWSLSMGQDYMLDLFKGYKKNENLTVKQAINLLANYQLYKVFETVLPITTPLVKKEKTVVI